MSKEKRQATRKKPRPLTPRDLMKLEIAEELGLLEKVRAGGWAQLSAQEAGLVGGVMSGRLRQKNRATGEKRGEIADPEDSGQECQP
ncbi:MAG: small, acid-soluble spore protein, alpha/beta type [Bacillota bacterium]